MTPVKLAICRTPVDRTNRAGAAARVKNVEVNGVTSMRFGDETVYCGEPQNWDRFEASAARAGIASQERADTVDRRRLHVVIQKGRLFQKEHPSVQILLDKGRFLLVEMDPELAKKLEEKKEPCYTIRAPDALDADDELGQNRIIFQTRNRAADRAAAPAADPAVQLLVDRISRTTFKADLTSLVELPTRFSTSTHYGSACDFVEQQLSNLGYATSRQTISINGLQSTNVVARREGRSPAPHGAVILTAHLDSINHEGTATSLAPGADDDGSGSAGVIEIARALKDVRSIHDLVFSLFGGEEQGLFGSKHFVRLLSAVERSRVRAVINMDMIGTLNTASPTVLLEGRAVSRVLLDGLAAAAASYTQLSVETSLNAANSDHVSFLDNGIPAVLTIEGGDSANDEIHTARDTLDRLNIDLALEILRMNTAFVAAALDSP
jgi:hypothetical protein